MSRQNIFNIAVAILIVLGAVVWIIYFGYRLYQEYELDWRGQTLTSYVTDRTTTSNEDGTWYYIHYRYDIGRGDPPQWLTGRDDVSRGFYDDHLIEDQVEVRYLPYRPSVSRVDHSTLARVDLICVNVINLALLAGFVFIVIKR